MSTSWRHRPLFTRLIEDYLPYPWKTRAHLHGCPPVLFPKQGQQVVLLNGQSLLAHGILDQIEQLVAGKRWEWPQMDNERDLTEEELAAFFAPNQNYAPLRGGGYRRVKQQEPQLDGPTDIKLPAFFPHGEGLGRRDYELTRKRFEALEALYAKQPLSPILQRAYEQAEQHLAHYRFAAMVDAGKRIAQHGTPAPEAVLSYPEHHANLVAGKLPFHMLARIAERFEQANNVEILQAQVEHLITSSIRSSKDVEPATPPVRQQPLPVSHFLARSAADEPRRQALIHDLTERAMQQQQRLPTATRLSYDKIKELMQQQYANMSHEQGRAVLSEARQKLIEGGPGGGKSKTNVAAVGRWLLQEGVRPEDIQFFSPTHSGMHVLKKGITKAYSTLFPQMQDETYQQQHFRTLHALALSKINARFQDQPSALEIILGEDAKLLGSGTGPMNRARTTEEVLKYFDQNQEDYARKILTLHQLKGVSLKGMLSEINRFKSNQGDKSYQSTLDEGKRLWEQGGEARKDPKALLYAYEQGLRKQKGFTPLGQHKRQIDLNDVIDVWRQAGNHYRKLVTPIKAFVGDEIQDLSPDQLRALWANSTPQTRMIMSGDMGQRMMSNINAFKGLQALFPQMERHQLTGNYRNAEWIAAYSRGLNEDPALQASGTSVSQVSVTGKRGTPPKHIIGTGFEQVHQAALKTWFKRMGLDAEAIRSNLAMGDKPFAWSNIPAREFPFIVNMDDERKMLREGLAAHLKRMGLSASEITQVMEQGVYEGVPGEQGSSPDMFHLLTTGQSRSQEFREVMGSAWRGGQWDDADWIRQQQIIASRAVDQLYWMGGDANFQWTGFNNRPEQIPGVGMVAAGHGAALARATQAMLETQELPEHELDPGLRSLAANPILVPHTTITQEKGDALRAYVRDALDQQRAFPVFSRQVMPALDARTGMLQADASELLDSSDDGDMTQLAGFVGYGRSIMAAATNQAGLSPDTWMFDLATRYADQLFTPGGASLFQQTLLAPAQQDAAGGTGPKALTDVLPIHSISAFMEAAKNPIGRISRDAYHGKDEDFSDFVLANPNLLHLPEDDPGQKIKKVTTYQFRENEKGNPSDEIPRYLLDRVKRAGELGALHTQHGPSMDQYYYPFDQAEGQTHLANLKALDTSGAFTRLPSKEELEYDVVKRRVLEEVWADALGQELPPQKETEGILEHWGDGTRDLLGKPFDQRLWGDMSRLDTLLGDNLDDPLFTSDVDLSRVLDTFAIREDQGIPVAGKYLAGYHLRAIAKRAQEIANDKSIFLNSDPEQDRQLRAHYQTLARQAEAFGVNVPKVGESVLQDPDLFRKQAQVDPREAQRIAYVLQDQQAKEHRLHPIESPDAKALIAKRLPQSRFASLRSIASPKKGHQLGVGPGYSAATPFMSEMARMAYRLETRGVLDPQNVFTVPATAEAPEQVWQLPGTVGLHAYQTRLSEQLAFGRQKPEQQRLLSDQLQQVEGIRQKIHDPLRQQAWGHTLNQVFRMTTGASAFDKTPSGTSQEFNQFFEPLRQQSQLGEMRLDQVEGLVSILEELAQDVQNRGVMNRGKVNRVLGALGLDTNAPFMRALPLLKAAGWRGPDDELPLYSITKKQNLVDLLAKLPGMDRAGLIEQFTRAPHLMGQTYAFRGGQTGFAPLGPNQRQFVENLGYIPGQTIMGTLAPYQKDLPVGVGMGKGPYIKEKLQTVAEMRATKQMPSDVGLHPLFSFEVNGQRMVVRADQISSLFEDVGTWFAPHPGGSGNDGGKGRPPVLASFPEPEPEPVPPGIVPQPEPHIVEALASVQPVEGELVSPSTPFVIPSQALAQGMARRRGRRGRRGGKGITSFSGDQSVPPLPLGKQLLAALYQQRPEPVHPLAFLSPAQLQRVATPPVLISAPAPLQSEQRTPVIRKEQVQALLTHQAAAVNPVALLSPERQNRLLQPVSVPEAMAPSRLSVSPMDWPKEWYHTPEAQPAPVSSPPPQASGERGQTIAEYLQTLAPPPLEEEEMEMPSAYLSHFDELDRADIPSAQVDTAFAHLYPDAQVAQPQARTMTLPRPAPAPAQMKLPFAEPEPAQMVPPPVEPEAVLTKQKPPVVPMTEAGGIPNPEALMPPTNNAIHAADIANWIVKGTPDQQRYKPPSPEQLGVYESQAPNIEVTGGPGGGKTSTIAKLMALMATRDHIPARNMLALSYMHSGREELSKHLARLSKDLPQDHPDFLFPEARTYYGLAHDIITKGARQIGKQVEYPVLEDFGLHWGGKTIRSLTNEERRRMSPEDLEGVIEPEHFLKQTLLTQGVRLDHDTLSTYWKNIEQAKSGRTDDPEDVYAIHHAQGVQDLAQGKMSSDAALVLYQNARKQKGHLDFYDYLYYGKKALDKRGLAALPEHLQRLQVVAADEAQDSTRISVGLLGSLMRAIAGNNPRMILGLDPMQSLIAERFGGINPNKVREVYAQALGPFEQHTLTRNYRSPRGVVSWINAILKHTRLKGESKSPIQEAMNSQLGEMPHIQEMAHQPAMYQQMQQDMFAHAGLSWEQMRENLDMGQHPLEGMDLKTMPSRLAGIFTQHRDRDLFAFEAKRTLSQRLGLTQGEAEKVFDQLFRYGSAGQEEAESDPHAEKKFQLLLHAGARSHDYREVFQDVTQVGGGDDIEYLKRVFVGASRPDAEGSNHMYWTQRPFGKTEQDIYQQAPQDLQPTAMGGWQLGYDAQQEPIILNKNKRNAPAELGGQLVPRLFDQPLREHIDDMLQQGVSPYHDYFQKAGWSPFAVQRAGAIEIIPREAMHKDVHPLMGPRFWARPDLEPGRAMLSPEKKSAIAQRLAAYPQDVQKEYHDFARQGMSPQDYLATRAGYAQTHLQLANEQQNAGGLIEAVGQLDYLREMAKNPHKFAQEAEKILVQAKQVTVQTGPNAQVTIHPAGGGGAPTAGGTQTPRPPLNQEAFLASAFAPSAAGGYPASQTPPGPGPTRKGPLSQLLPVPGGSLSSRGGSSTGPAGSASGGGSSGGGGGGGGFNNTFVQAGRTFARIGDELAYIGQYMQKTADSALQEGGDYRHATLAIPRGTAQLDPYGRDYSTLNQGKDQTEQGAANGFSEFWFALTDPHGFGEQINDWMGWSGKKKNQPDPNGSKTSAAGDNGTQGFFDPTDINNKNSIAYLQHNTLPMYSMTQIAQEIQAYTSALNQPFSLGSVQGSTDILALAAMTGLDQGSLTSQFASITGYGANGANKDQQIARLSGIMEKTFHGNLTEQNVSPYLSAMETVLPTLQGLAGPDLTHLGFHETHVSDQTAQAAAIFQMSLNAGMNAQNLPDVANMINNLAQIGSAPDLRGQYALNQLFPGQITAAPQLVQYNQQMLGYQQSLAGMQLQQKMHVADLHIQADNAQLDMDKLNIQQGEFSLAQNQASFGFNQWMQTQQYGAIGADSSRTAYFSFLRNQLAAGYNPANADQSTTFQPATPFGLKNEEFYAGIENQRSMLTLGRSPLLADAAFQQQMKYLNEQENFYVRELQLQNDQRSFDQEWGQRSLDMQAVALDLQKKQFPIQQAQLEYDKAQTALQDQYLPQQIDLLQQLIANTSDMMNGKGPVNGKNVDPISIITQLQAYFKSKGAQATQQELQAMGLSQKDIGILMNILSKNQNMSAQQLMAQLQKEGDAGILGDLQTAVNQGGYAGATNTANGANGNLAQGGVGQNWDQLIQAMKDDSDKLNAVNQAMSGTTGLTQHIADLSKALSPASTGIGTLSNIFGALVGFLGGGGGGGGGAGGAFGIGGAGGPSVPPPLPLGVGGSAFTPGQEGNPLLSDSARDKALTFWSKLLSAIDAKRYGQVGAQSGIAGTSMNYGIITPHINAAFNAPMRYGKHQGVDFAANEGTPLREFVGGKVVAASMAHDWGGEVDVQVPGGMIERYLHLSQIGVGSGKTIKQGDAIGLTGGGTKKSGLGYWSSGSHLHVQYDRGNINAGLDPWPIWQKFGEKNLAQYVGEPLPKTPAGNISNNPFTGNGDLFSWIVQGMMLTHAPTDWLTDLGIIAMHESGGNPNAINLWDSNAAAGHPSKGLFQTIDSTFASYALPGHTSIYNPIDNTAAAIGYIKGRYGTVYDVPGIVSMSHGGPYVGYGDGGVATQPQLAHVAEKEPEAIIPLSKLKSVMQSLHATTGGAPAVPGMDGGARTISIQNLVGTMNLTVSASGDGQLSDTEKDALMADLLDVLHSAAQQLNGRL